MGIIVFMQLYFPWSLMLEI